MQKAHLWRKTLQAAAAARGEEARARGRAHPFAPSMHAHRPAPARPHALLAPPLHPADGLQQVGTALNQQDYVWGDLGAGGCVRARRAAQLPDACEMI